MIYHRLWLGLASNYWILSPPQSSNSTIDGQKTSRNLLSTIFLPTFWSMHIVKQRNQEWQVWDRKRLPIKDATIWHLERENSLKSPLVFPLNFLLFLWCEVILNIECLVNLLWSLAFDHISHCLTGKIQQILYIQIFKETERGWEGCHQKGDARSEEEGGGEEEAPSDNIGRGGNSNRASIHWGQEHH